MRIVIINENFNYIYSKPYFVACSDASTNIVVGKAPYDIIILIILMIFLLLDFLPIPHIFKIL